MFNNAPIILFAYKRLDVLKKTIEALSANYLAPESDLIIFSDYAKSENDVIAVEQVRSYLKSITGFRKVEIFNSDKNKGLAKSIIEGVSKVFNTYDKAIVLEDDILTTPNFLNFMNEALTFYEENKNIYSISGFTTPIKIKPSYAYDVYFSYRSYSWGWATWKDRWINVDWNLNSDVLNNKVYNNLIEKAGTDLKRMLKNKELGKIDSWAVIWCVNQAIQGKLAVFPVRSKTLNIGFNNEATHTNQKFNRFATILDNQVQKRTFNLSSEVSIDHYINRQFFKPFGMKKRVLYKLMNIMKKL